MNNHELLELVARRAGLDGTDDLLTKCKTTEYVRARAVAVMLLTDRGVGVNEIGRLLNHYPKTIRHARDTWPHVWAKDATARRLYEECQATAEW